MYWDRKGIWGKGYFVSTVGINEEVIRKYVQSQAEEETGQARLSFKCTKSVKAWESIYTIPGIEIYGIESSKSSWCSYFKLRDIPSLKVSQYLS